MVETIVIVALFLTALVYLGNVVRKSFSTKSVGCAKGCGACGAIDFNKIEAQIAAKEKKQAQAVEV